MANEYVIKVKVIPDFSEFERKVKESSSNIKVGVEVESKGSEGSVNVPSVSRTGFWFIDDIRYMKNLIDNVRGGVEVANNVGRVMPEYFRIMKGGTSGFEIKGGEHTDLAFSKKSDKSLLDMLGFGSSGGKSGGLMGGSSMAGAGSSALTIMAVIYILKSIMALVRKIVELFSEASPMFKEMLKIFRMTFLMILRPIADMFAMIFMPLGLFLLGFFTGIYTKWMEDMKKSGEIGGWAEFLKQMFNVGYEWGRSFTTVMENLVNEVVRLWNDGSLNLTSIINLLFDTFSDEIEAMIQNISDIFLNWFSTEGSNFVNQFMNLMVNDVFGWIDTNSQEIFRLINEVLTLAFVGLLINSQKITMLVKSAIDIMADYIRDNGVMLMSGVAQAIIDGIEASVEATLTPSISVSEVSGGGMFGAIGSFVSNAVGGGVFGSSGNVTINVNVNNANATAEDIVERLKEELYRGGF